MDTQEVLKTLVAFASPRGVDTDRLCEHLRQMSEDERIDWVAALGDGVTSGAIGSEAWALAAGSKPVGDLAPAVGMTWDALFDADLADSLAELPSDRWTRDTLRIWAYTEEWILLDQDEDLLLMEDEFAPWLIEVASEPDCPKADYALSIAAHWARDKAFSAAGEQNFPDVVAQIAGLAAVALKGGLSELGSYLARLGSYGRTAPVNRAGATQRGLDLTRCRKPGGVKVTEENGEWIVALPSVPAKTIRISCRDGRIR